MFGGLGVARVVSLAALAVIIVLVFWPDEPIEPEAAEVLAPRARLAPHTNAFNHVAGMGLGAKVDSVERAHDAVQAVNSLLVNPDADPATVAAAWLPTPEITQALRTLCDFTESDCLAAIRVAQAEIAELGKAHQPWLARYQSLRELDAFATELVSHPEAPMVSVAPLMAVHRLSLALRVLDPDPNRAAQAIERVEFTIAGMLLGEADSLIVKMVAAAMMVQAIRARVALSPNALPLSRLTSAQLAMGRAIDGEFRFLAAGIEMVASADMLRSDFHLPDWFPDSAVRTLARPLFKPGRSTNRTFQCLKAGADEQARACTAPIAEWILNPIGAVLFEVGRPDFSRYRGRLQNLDALIVLSHLARTISAKRNHGAIGPDAIAALVGELGREHRHPATGELPAWDADTTTLFYPSIAERPGWYQIPLWASGP